MQRKRTSGKVKSYSSGVVSRRIGGTRILAGPSFQRLNNHIENVAFRRANEALTQAQRDANDRAAGIRPRPVHVEVEEEQQPDGQWSPATNHLGWEDQQDADRLADVLTGQERIHISHEGDAVANLISQLRLDIGPPTRRRDGRARRDRVETRNAAFAGQRPELVDAYAHYQATRGPDGWENRTLETPEGVCREELEVDVIDIFGIYTSKVAIFSTDKFTASAFVRCGLLPCAPFKPTLAVTIRAMEFYRCARLRAPRFAMQAFSSCLADFHGIPVRRYLSQQLTICYDLLILMRDGLAERLRHALLRDTPNWRLANACPPCMYVLEGEAPMKISMLLAMDGNSSLSRIKGFRKPSDIEGDGAAADEATTAAMEIIAEETPAAVLEDDAAAARPEEASRGDAEEVPRPSGGDAGAEVPHSGKHKHTYKCPHDHLERNERGDKRDGRGDYILTREEVDKWAKETFAHKWEGAGEPDESGCESRWHNMVNDFTSRTWGIYDETGVFLGICRHAMVCLATDMVESGELAKYPLAMINKLLQVLNGLNICIGYDCGCKFKKTAGRSALGGLIKSRSLAFAVGLFHGHAHGRVCQLYNLGTYIVGMGLEDLEACERFFSKSNALAAVIRHSSTFHRHQAIRGYFEHMDEIESFQALSIFLYGNVKQALEIVATKGSLQVTMGELGIPNTKVFDTWLAEEKEYLATVTKEPEDESLRIEYFKALEALDALEVRRDAVLEFTTVPFVAGLKDETLALERTRRHVFEQFASKEKQVQYLETKLNIAKRWGRGSAERQQQAALAATREYRLALDKLEGLVVARIFELTKMNMSQTGYKLRQHIAKALQVRSKAVRAALIRYNDAAMQTTPKRATLEWDDVVAYGFLSEFDLLRDSRMEIQHKKWAAPASRRAMDKSFKIQRAEEELVRCKIEARRLLTYMVDEEVYLRAAYRAHRESSPDIAHQIQKRYWFRKAMHQDHRKRLQKIEQLPNFNAVLSPGRRLGRRPGFEPKDFEIRPPSQFTDNQQDMDVDSPPSSTPGVSRTPSSSAMVVDDPPALAGSSQGAADSELPGRSVAQAGFALSVEKGDLSGDVDGEFDWEDEEEEAAALETAVTIAEISLDSGS